MQQTWALASIGRPHNGMLRCAPELQSKLDPGPSIALAWGQGSGGDCARTWLLRRLKTSQNGCPTMLGLSRPGPPQACPR
jgi:hypothetical protein